MAASTDATSAQSYSTDPALYLYTSLTAGSSHIVTATSRLETILRANRVPFKALDLATDDKARMLWGRRAGKDETGRVRKLPGLVQMGMILGDLVEIEEWNEYGELKEHVTMYYDEYTQPPISQAPKPPPPAPKPAPVTASTPADPPPAPGPAPTPSSHPVAAAAAAAAAEQASRKSVESTRTVASSAPSTATRSIAEEAAAKAKQVRLQSLRNKVYGKNAGSKESVATEGEGARKSSEEGKAGTGGSGSGSKKPSGEKEGEEGEEQPRVSVSTVTSSDLAVGAPDGQSVSGPSSGRPSFDPALMPPPLSLPKAGAGLQSPTSGAWKDDPVLLPRTLQSPNTTSWKPTDVDDPITSYQGSAISNPSKDEIEAIEKAEAIREEPDKEDAADAAEEGGGGEDGKKS